MAASQFPAIEPGVPDWFARFVRRLPSFFNARLGFTPANVAGDTFTGKVKVSAGAGGTPGNPSIEVTASVLAKSTVVGAGYSMLDAGGAAGVSGFYSAWNAAGTRIGYTGFFDGTYLIGAMTDGATPLAFGTGAAGQLCFGAAGNFVGLGPRGVMPTSAIVGEFFSIYTNTSAQNVVAVRPGASWGSATAFLSYPAAGATAFDHLGCYTAGVAKARIDSAGNFFSATNSYGSISSREAKENIVDATPKLADLMRLRLVNFNLIGDDLKQFGAIVEEVELIWPALVMDIPERTDPETGAVIQRASKGLKYNLLPLFGVKAIQEQQVMIEALTRRVALLENT